MLSFLEGELTSNLNDSLLDKIKIYLEEVNNQKEYFRDYENVCCMIFLKNMLMSPSHIALIFPSI